MRVQSFNLFLKAHLLPILALFFFEVQGRIPLLGIGDDTKEIFITKYSVGVFVDSSNTISNGDIVKVPDQLFLPSKGKTIANLYSNGTYWIKFLVADSSSKSKQWLLESFNYKLNHLQIVIPELDYVSPEYGDIYFFNTRDIKHKNFIFKLPRLQQSPKVVFIKVRTKQVTNLQFVLRESDFFLSYAVLEYFLLGTFYGLILMVALYNLFLFIVFRRSPFIFYFGYILATIVYFMTNDGTSFQLLWPSYPWLNQYCFQFAHFLMVVFFSLYAKSFLQIDNIYPWINKLYYWFIAIRIIVFIISLISGYHFNNHILYIDFLPFIFTYLVVLFIYKQDKNNYFFFIIAFSIIAICFTINGMRLMRVIPSNLFTFYSIYVGVMFEMLFLTLGLSTRLNSIVKFGILKDRLNKLLTNKLKDSSQTIGIQGNLIKEREAEIETLFYRLSHDIKGPLKSIKGLALLGMIDQEPDKKYYNMILDRLEHLNFMTDDFVEISKIKKEAPSSKECVQVEELILGIVKSNIEVNRDPNFQLDIMVNQIGKFYVEKNLLTTVVQNILENAYQYRKVKAIDSYLKISATSDHSRLHITFEDNGIGIPADLKAKVFQMFYRANEHKDNASTGLGLYIVKIALDKMSGTISVDSEVGKGTTFTVSIPNLDV